MSRTVAALYDSRAEAEMARNRLVSGAKAKLPRIIARDTLGAVDGLAVDPKAKARYRDAVRDGAYLLVAELPPGTKPQQVVGLLDVTTARRDTEEPPSQLPNQPVADGQPAFEVADRPREAPAPSPLQQRLETPLPPKVDKAPPPPPLRVAEKPTTPEPAIPAAAAVPPPPAAPMPKADAVPPKDASPAPAQRNELPVDRSDELRVGQPTVARGGARLRSFTRECPAEEQIMLRDEIVEVESRPSERRLSDKEIKAGGLFKNRVIDIAEMREEPVITKTAVVREEVIVRKRVEERVETVRDTVKRTQVAFDDEPGDAAPRFFNRNTR
jgi:hypothetical protein